MNNKNSVFQSPHRWMGSLFQSHHARTKKTTMPTMAATPAGALAAGAEPGNVGRLEVGLGGKTVPVPVGVREVGA